MSTGEQAIDAGIEPLSSDGLMRRRLTGGLLGGAALAVAPPLLTACWSGDSGEGMEDAIDSITTVEDWVESDERQAQLKADTEDTMRRWIEVINWCEGLRESVASSIALTEEHFPDEPERGGHFRENVTLVREDNSREQVSFQVNLGGIMVDSQGYIRINPDIPERLVVVLVDTVEIDDNSRRYVNQTNHSIRISDYQEPEEGQGESRDTFPAMVVGNTQIDEQQAGGYWSTHNKQFSSVEDMQAFEQSVVAELNMRAAEFASGYTGCVDSDSETSFLPDTIERGGAGEVDLSSPVEL